MKLYDHPLYRADVSAVAALPLSWETLRDRSLLISGATGLIGRLLTDRQRILSTDPKAKELHQEILKKNQELAALLESKRAIREMSHELLLIDARIQALDPKPKPVPAAEKAPAPAAVKTPPAAPAPEAAKKDDTIQPVKKEN